MNFIRVFPPHLNVNVVGVLKARIYLRGGNLTYAWVIINVMKGGFSFLRTMDTSLSDTSARNVQNMKPGFFLYAKPLTC